MPAWILLAVTYVSGLVFLAAIVSRFVKISRLPIHLRWELYPVAHDKGRAHYGGSYLEESNWWTKPRETSHLGELKVMIPEILLLKGVWEHNRQHWFRSFPFHFGLYLLAGLVFFLFVGGIATAAGANVSAEGGGLWKLLHHATYIVGYPGMVLGLVGSIALLLRRAANADYREYTKKADYFNLLFFTATFVVALLAHAIADPQFVALRGYFAELVTLGAFSAPEPVALSGVAGSELLTLGGDATAASAPLLVSIEVILISLLVAYIPLTHMSHFFTKWFMYHDIRWNDEPNMPGGKIEKRVQEVLQYPVSWSAPHIRGDGKKNWVDVATSPVEEDEEK